MRWLRKTVYAHNTHIHAHRIGIYSWFNVFVVRPVTACTTSRDAPADLTTFRFDSSTRS